MKNKNGIEVKVCCASCKYKKLTRTTLRYCRKKQVNVSPHDVCDEWEISNLLKSICRNIETNSRKMKF